MPFDTLTPSPNRQETIRSYLEEHVIPFHVSALLSGGAVRVVRAGQLIIPHSDGFNVNDGDSVSIVKPWPNAVNTLLTAQYSFGQFLDVTCAPRASGTFGDLVTTLLRQRPRTTHVDGVDSLQTFLRRVRQSRVPIGDLMLFTHAWSSGWLKMHLKDPQPGDTPELNYEDLERVVDDDSFKLPAELLIPGRRHKRGHVVRRRFQIRGCRIGLADPFLKLLKRVLGHTFEIAAAKHWEFLLRTQQHDMLEYLKYSFPVLRSGPFTNRPQALAAFAAEGFRFIPSPGGQVGAQVPAQRWGEWIPANPNLSRSRPLTQQFAIPFQPGSVTLAIDYERSVETVLAGQAPIADVSPSPGPKPTEEQKRNAVRTYLQRFPQRFPEYREGHEFPAWRRWGLPTLESFIKTLDVGGDERRPSGGLGSVEWGTNAVTFDVRIHLFEVRVPIAEPSTRVLIANYYPINPSNPAVENVDVTDGRLFAIV